MKEPVMTVPQSAKTPYALGPGEGKTMGWLGATVTLKASAPEIGVTEVIISCGEEPPMHVHKNEDEWFYMLDGEMTFHVGGHKYRRGPGAFVSFPKGIPHTFEVETGKARFLVMNTPGGFERMFEYAPKTEEEIIRALEALGMTVVGPHPRAASTVRG
jgi:quercetin dioxygenase-like cupin family protein